MGQGRTLMATATTNATAPLSLVNYQTRLPSFEGPLDLLLRLIERQKLDITEVSLVAVTDQFLAFVATMEDAPLEVIAEFTAVGTRLTVLKSRSLLPRPPVQDEDEEPDPDDLVQQLRAYKRLKIAAAELGKRREDGFVAFGHRGTGSIARRGEVAPTRLMQYDASVLVRAIKRRLSTIPVAVQTIRQRRIVSIREMTDRVTSLLDRFPSVSFGKIVEGYETRSDTATAFLATLVMIRRGTVDAVQDGLFREITISHATLNGVEPDERIDVDDEFIN
jgi:segregation and condensation protein A